MGMAHYLAVTAAELWAGACPPGDLAWLGCHFSPYGLGLSNLPRSLPQGSLLILDDVTPMGGHDPAVIGEQLRELVEALGCAGVLLDFQRAGCPRCTELAKHLGEVLPCPLAVSARYAEGLPGPVFLPPVPCYRSLEEHLAPWQGREIWLEASLDARALTLTSEGCAEEALPVQGEGSGDFLEERLHCHYRIETGEDMARFTLYRTRQDLAALLGQAEGLGVARWVGLYQELGDFSMESSPSEITVSPTDTM